MDLKKVKEIEGRGKTLIIYGDSGKGKTWLAGTLPENKTLIIDIDGGIETLIGTGSNHTFIQLRMTTEDLEAGNIGYSRLVKLFAELRENEGKYEYIVVDSMSELEKYLLYSLKTERGKEFLSMSEYGGVADQLREIIRWFRDLTEQGINVIFTALEMPLAIQENENGTITRAFPMLMKKLSPEFCGLVDMIGRVEVNPKTQERRIRFMGNDDIIAKTRIAGVGEFENPDLGALFEKINGVSKEKKTKKEKGGKE